MLFVSYSAIGAMSAGVDDAIHRQRIDLVFSQAVERGIVLRKDTTLDSIWEFDLSGMTLPVARAAVRFLLLRILRTSVKYTEVEVLHLITGVGVNKVSECGQTSLREYVQEILWSDFDPGIPSTIPKRAQGTVEVSVDSILAWMKRQHT